jgi:queuine tRNA-ribosyltransferase
MDAQTFRSDQVIAKNKERLAHVDDEGVTFKSHLDGSMHRFTAEVSMQIQHQLGADIMFAFDECTTLHNTRLYQELAMSRTYDWAIRCLDEHKRLTDQRADKPYQALFGVIQGAQYEDLRKKASTDLGGMSSSGIQFDGFGIGGALDKDSLGTIVGWVNSTLPQEKPKHLLGIGAPEDLFVGVENGVDTFDCVLASRIARTSSVYTMIGRFNVSNAPYVRDFNPIDDQCDCYTCQNYTRAYLCHLFRGKEMLAGTLATIHNERFIVRLVDQMREALINGTFQDMKKEFMGRYTHKSGQSRD